MRRLLSLLLCLSLVSLSSEVWAAPSSGTQSGAKSGGARNGKAAAAVAWPEEVSLTAADGQAIKARLGAAAAAKQGVVLVHDARGNGLAWRRAAEAMVAEGWAAIAVDLRGHGISAFTPARELQMVDYQAAAGDVRAAVAALRARGVEKVAIIGAGFGGTLALAVAAEDPAVPTIAVISPGLALQGMPAPPLLERYGKRPVMFVASSSDPVGSAAATQLHEAAHGLKQLRSFDARRGAIGDFQQADPAFASTLVSYLRATWSSPLPPESTTGPRNVEVERQDAGAVGNRFGQ